MDSLLSIMPNFVTYEKHYADVKTTITCFTIIAWIQFIAVVGFSIAFAINPIRDYVIACFVIFGVGSLTLILASCASVESRFQTQRYYNALKTEIDANDRAYSNSVTERSSQRSKIAQLEKELNRFHGKKHRETRYRATQKGKQVAEFTKAMRDDFKLVGEAMSVVQNYMNLKSKDLYTYVNTLESEMQDDLKVFDAKLAEYDETKERVTKRNSESKKIKKSLMVEVTKFHDGKVALTTDRQQLETDRQQLKIEQRHMAEEQQRLVNERADFAAEVEVFNRTRDDHRELKSIRSRLDSMANTIQPAPVAIKPNLMKSNFMPIAPPALPPPTYGSDWSDVSL